MHLIPQMPKVSSLIILCLTIALTSSAQEVGRLSEKYHNNGQLMSRGYRSGGSKCGNWIYYHRNGKIHSKESYSCEIIDTAIRIDPETLEEIVDFGVTSHKHGTFEVYDSLGNQTSKYNYIEGEKHGDAITIKNGKKTIYTYVSDSIVHFKLYHKNGQLHKDCKVKEGKMHGTMRIYDDKGNLFEAKEMREGRY